MNLIRVISVSEKKEAERKERWKEAQRKEGKEDGTLQKRKEGREEERVRWERYEGRVKEKKSERKGTRRRNGSLSVTLRAVKIEEKYNYHNLFNMNAG